MMNNKVHLWNFLNCFFLKNAPNVRLLLSDNKIRLYSCWYLISGLKVLSKKHRDCYQSIHFDILSCQQVSFSGPKWTPLQEEHKLFKGIVRPFDFGAWLSAHSIRYNKLEAQQILLFIFNITISRANHKTIYRGLRITESLVQSKWVPGVFQSPASQFKN
jgi:hypothetical protein